MTDTSKRTDKSWPHRRIRVGPVLTSAEQRRLWVVAASLDVRGRLAFTLLSEMALRPREVCGLTYGSIQPDALAVDTEKTARVRMAPLGAETRYALDGYLALYPPNGEADRVLLQVDVVSLGAMVRALGRDADLDRTLSLHDLRRAAIRRTRAAYRKEHGK